ncbi:hypothetical protein [Streptococcus suis]|nr:hypothetical protein [Streptococcus suis]CYU74383.1 integral membrane protein%3B branched-chain amino acid permease [Streptococcus suis]
MKEHTFREGLRDAIPTALGYASIVLCGGASGDALGLFCGGDD